MQIYKSFVTSLNGRNRRKKKDTLPTENHKIKCFACLS